MSMLSAGMQAANISISPPVAGHNFRFIRLEGPIIGGDAEQLTQALQSTTAAGGRAAVVLASEGGDIDVGMALGQAIRRAGAVTFHGYCASACVFAYLGGVQRYMTAGDGALLAIHRPELAEAHLAAPSAFTTQMLAVLRTYIESMVGSRSLYDAMMLVPFSELRTLQPQEALSMQVATVVR